jgi:hypothetical protein
LGTCSHHLYEVQSIDYTIPIDHPTRGLMSRQRCKTIHCRLVTGGDHPFAKANAKDADLGNIAADSPGDSRRESPTTPRFQFQTTNLTPPPKTIEPHFGISRLGYLERHAMPFEPHFRRAFSHFPMMEYLDLKYLPALRQTSR